MNTIALLPARMSLNLDALVDLNIAVLSFPYAKEVANFRRDMEQVLSGGKKREVTPPYRQLNNGLLACAPTLTHGFEYFGFDQENNISQYRALAVGTPENPLQMPTPQQMQQLIQIWAQEWTGRYRDKGKKDVVNSVCDRLIDQIAIIPPDWQWQPIEPKTLVNDVNSEQNLIFQAIPSLLATLLHEKICVICSGNREQEIRWRKVQGGGADKTGLFLVSQPFIISYSQDGKERQGYFVYRLDFSVQTQTGRFNQQGKLKPWIFLHLSCQRYAHEPLIEPNYGRDISVLLGMNEERLSGYEVDSTLVRLVITNSGSEENYLWKFQLPELLTAFKARNLNKPEEILGNPVTFGNLDNLTNWYEKDEYYLIHAEGYKYAHESHKRGHSIKTGFTLRERGDITAQVLEFLNGVLIPDVPMQCDTPTPSGKKTPLAMRDYDFIATPPTFTSQQQTQLSELEKAQRIDKRRCDRQLIIADAILRAVQGKPIYLFILWYEQDTYDVIWQQLRNAFLLNDDDTFPENVKVSLVRINDATLLQPLETDGLAPKDGDKFDNQIRKQYEAKREAWRTFIQKHVTPLISDFNSYRFAIIEIGQIKKKGVHPRQSIRGAIREACVLEKINSQMVQTVKPSQSKEHKNALPYYSKRTTGRVMSAVLDITLRQTGTLYGLPAEVYERAGIPGAIAQNLDVIAFCHRKTNQEDIHYALAVRLQATGSVEIMLPNSDASHWISYAQAGIEVGRLFSKARRDRPTAQKLRLSYTQLAQFVADMLMQVRDRPTLVLIEADGWRNERGEGNDKKAWFQLKNEYLLPKRDILDFRHVPGHTCEYQRDSEQLKNLLGIIRLRTGKETPQYITNRADWHENTTARDFTHLSSFLDTSVPELLHYFSIGRLPKTQKAQDTLAARELYMLDYDLQSDEYGANIAFKHQQMVEMVPFFVRPDFQTQEGLKSLCRVPHYLRCSPAWSMGNILFPYPMHLGKQLISDQLCILGIDE